VFDLRQSFPNLPRLVIVSDIEVQDNPDRSRFEITVDGTVAGFAAYRVRDGLVIVTHSQVDPAYQGQGLGSKLVIGTLDQLRDRGATVVPACPFFAKYVSTHHEWDEILAN
jgi:predicted GNAT family acetyltransferase